MPENRPKAEEKSVKTHPKDASPSPADKEEIGGPKGLEPTRYGDWERGGRCVDF